jgi:hypothetical protein
VCFARRLLTMSSREIRIASASLSARPPARFAPSLLAFLIAVGIAFVIARTYMPFVADDSLISFRYSERLLSGQGLTFTTGERVEGYSNLLWVLVVAAGGLFTPDLILAGRVLGLLCMACALAALVRAFPVRSVASAFPMIAALAALALSHNAAVWAIGGLESLLVVALLAWTLSLLVSPRSPVDVPAAVQGGAVDDVPAVVGLLLALLVLARSDGAIFAALVAAGLIATHGASPAILRRLARLLALPVLAWLGQLAFRLAYYGDWLPNPAYIKLAWSLPRAAQGAHYLWDGLLRHAPFALLAIVGLATTKPFRRREVLIPLAVGVGWAAYVVLIGGDIFPGRRHFLPALVCLAFLVPATWRHGWIGRLSPAFQAVILVAACLGYAGLQRADPENVRARDEQWEWRCGDVATTLRLAFEGSQPLIAADPVGCVAYFGKLPTLDLLGLNDRHIARTRPPYVGQGIIGHEFGDGWYVLSRKPDIVLLCGPEGSATGCFKSGVELARAREFKDEYVLVPVNSVETGFRSLLWFRTTSERLGIVRAAQGIRVPGFLFGAGGAVPVSLSAGQRRRLVAHLPSGGAVRFDQIALGPGPWQARAVASSPVDVVVDDAGIRVTAGAAASDLAEVVLTRIASPPRDARHAAEAAAGAGATPARPASD